MGPLVQGLGGLSGLGRFFRLGEVFGDEGGVLGLFLDRLGQGGDGSDGNMAYKHDYKVRPPKWAFF